MKKLLAAMIGLAMVGWNFVPVAAAEQQPDISAQAAVLVEVETGRVLYEKNADEQLPMASTTKVMTAILAVEKGNLNDVVTVPPEGSGVEGSSMYLNAGEHITLENLLYGLMLWSGNDAAVTIAIHIGGSVENFVQMMTEKAVALGATHTRFANPNGLPSSEHYTTARDWAIISAYAMKNPTFRTIVSTRQRSVEWEGHEWSRSLQNKNKMLYNYEGANGVKTGFTKAAGRCLVSSAERDGIQVVSVVLNAPDMYEDSSALLDYGFANLERMTVVQANDLLGEIKVMNGVGIESLELRAQRDIVLTLLESDRAEVRQEIDVQEVIEAPVQKGQKLGVLRVYLGETLIDEQNLWAKVDVEAITYGYYLDKIFRDWTGTLGAG